MKHIITPIIILAAMVCQGQETATNKFPSPIKFIPSDKQDSVIRDAGFQNPYRWYQFIDSGQSCAGRRDTLDPAAFTVTNERGRTSDHRPFQMILFPVRVCASCFGWRYEYLTRRGRPLRKYYHVWPNDYQYVRTGSYQEWLKQRR